MPKAKKCIYGVGEKTRKFNTRGGGGYVRVYSERESTVEAPISGQL